MLNRPGFIVATNALIDMDKSCPKPSPIPIRSPIPGDHNVRLDWNYPDDKILEQNGTLHFHPMTWCRLIRRTNGSDAALDELRRLLHLKIDHMFQQIRDDDGDEWAPIIAKP